jgi:hypothetical protein
MVELIGEENNLGRSIAQLHESSDDTAGVYFLAS